MNLLWLLLLLLCFQTVCFWHTAAKQHQQQQQQRQQQRQRLQQKGILSHECDEERNYVDYSARQVDADNNQLRAEEQVKQQQQQQQQQQHQQQMQKEKQLLVKQRPAVQVKVTNEVESAPMRAQKQRLRRQRGRRRRRRRRPNGNGNGHADNEQADIQNIMTLSQDNGNFLMSPNVMPILERNYFDCSVIDGQMIAYDDNNDNNDDDEQQLRLQDYNLLYNAERHTHFQLHTSSGNPTTTTTTSTSTMSQLTSGNRLLQQVVGNTLSAAFGLNANGGQNTITTTTTHTVGLYDAASLRQSSFNPFKPTRIIIHGWLGNGNANIYSHLVPAYMELSNGNYNIFTVDWGRGAIADYITASYRVKPVGQVLAKFLDFLHKEAGMRYEDLQLIGFSMGAHVAGLAGKHVQTGRVRVIRALDPALPFFRYAQEKERLTKSDADYVEVLHTSAGNYGFDRPLGHVDFYANWGAQQPGCFWYECSHWRAFDLFRESLKPNGVVAAFEAKGCQPTEWQELTRYKRCPRQTGSRLHMGGDLGELSMEQLAQREGVYYFETKAKPPYNL